MSDPAPDSNPAGKHGQAPPIDWDAPQLTLRAVLTGMALGALLCTCNIYAGLKIGWGFNMSVTAALLSFGLWNGARQISGKRIKPWGLLENNINQTACSSAAAVSSAGLVAPIPALAMLTGQSLSWPFLALWCFSVMMVGIVVAIPLRHQMIVVERLPFAFGIAAAETLREMYAKGAEALARVAHLVGAALGASCLALLAHFKVVGSLLFPFSVRGFPASTLTVSLSPSLLLVGVGGLIGFRACVSLLLGAVLGYVVIAPPLIHDGSLELQVSERLDRLPSGLTLRTGEHPRFSYDYDRHQLHFMGVMSHAELDELLALSDYPPYRKAVRKLYPRSQLAWEAPLAALPSGLDLEGKGHRARRRIPVTPERISAGMGELLVTPEPEALSQALAELEGR